RHDILDQTAQSPLELRHVLVAVLTGPVEIRHTTLHRRVDGVDILAGRLRRGAHLLHSLRVHTLLHGVLHIVERIRSPPTEPDLRDPQGHFLDPCPPGDDTTLEPPTTPWRWGQLPIPLPIRPDPHPCRSASNCGRIGLWTAPAAPLLRRWITSYGTPGAGPVDPVVTGARGAVAARPHALDTGDRSALDPTRWAPGRD